MKLAPKLALPFVLSLSFAWVQFATVAHAEEHRGDEHHEMHGGGGHPTPPPRAAPPKFQAHPPGVHPHGPMVRPHAVRVAPGGAEFLRGWSAQSDCSDPAAS